MRGRHARSVQTSDYSAALKVCYSVIKEKICFTNFLFGLRNSRPYVYCTVTEVHAPKKKVLFRLIPPTRIKGSSFAVFLLVLTHSHILCLPIAVCTLEYHLNLFSSCAGMLCLSLKSCSVCRGRIGHLNAISLSFLSTVFHCLLSCQLLQDNTNRWLQKVSVIESVFGT